MDVVAAAETCKLADLVHVLGGVETIVQVVNREYPC